MKEAGRRGWRRQGGGDEGGREGGGGGERCNMLHQITSEVAYAYP